MPTVQLGGSGTRLGEYAALPSDDSSRVGQESAPALPSSPSSLDRPRSPSASGQPLFNDDAKSSPADNDLAEEIVKSLLLDKMSAHTRALRDVAGGSQSAWEKHSSASSPPLGSSQIRRESAMSTASSTFDIEDACSVWPRQRRKRMSREMRVVMVALGCALVGGLIMGYMLSDWYIPGAIVDDLPFALVGQQSFDELADGQNAWWDEASWDDASFGRDTNDAERLKHIIPFQDDPNHVLVPIMPLKPPAPLLQPIADRLPHDMLTEYYVTGLIPESATPENTPRQQPLDLVYLFVNATSPFFQEEMEARARTEHLFFRPNSHRWRDNGELRGAIRSAVASLGDGLRKVHVLSGDYNFDHDEYRDLLPYRDEIDLEAGIEGWKMGQVPHWLDWDRVQAGKTRLTWHFHSDVYRLPSDHGVVPSNVVDEFWHPSDEQRKRSGMSPGAAVEVSAHVEDVWRDASLPTFNSFEIESRVGWISGLSENFISSNDDMFMLAEMSTSDFYHPLLGHMTRLEPYQGLLVPPVLTPNLLSTDGEWGGLQYASMLISSRFPARSRMYSQHMPKSLSKSIIQEASIMFAHDLSVAATRGFRQSQRGKADVEMSWLAMHLQVERWREALLWSWIVAKVGGSDGIWGEDARQQLREVLKLQDDYDGWSNVNVTKGGRSTLVDMMSLDQQVAWESPKRTRWLFSSMDGHLPWNANRLQLHSCTFAMETCLPKGFMQDSTAYDAADIFRNITFAKPDCGDCLISALIAASGQRGLSAFLPGEDATYLPDKRGKSMWERSEPVLPLTPTWQEADFSIKHVVRPGQDVWEGIEARPDGAVRMREWCIKLLSRYAFTFASTNSHFGQIERYNRLVTTLRDIDRRPEVSMLCLNDDQPDGDAAATKKLLEQWMEDRWGSVPIEWERKVGRTKVFDERTIAQRAGATSSSSSSSSSIDIHI